MQIQNLMNFEASSVTLSMTEKSLELRLTEKGGGRHVVVGPSPQLSWDSVMVEGNQQDLVSSPIVAASMSFFTVAAKRKYGMQLTLSTGKGLVSLTWYTLRTLQTLMDNCMEVTVH